MKKRKIAIGDVLKIDLGNGKHSYAQVSTDPLVIFFDHISSEELALSEIDNLPIAFKLHVFSRDLQKGSWEYVGNLPLSPERSKHPMMFNQDPLSGRLYLYHPDFRESNFVRPATLVECQGLERAAVWEAEHIEDRLKDHFRGEENKWVRAMAINESLLP